MVVTIEEIFDEPSTDRITCLKESGNSEFKIGEYEKAIHYYTEALDLVRKDTTLQSPEMTSILLTNRGNAYLKINRIDECIADCTDSISANPSYGKAYYRRALAYEQQAEYDKAVEDMDKLFELCPDMKRTESTKYRSICEKRDAKFESQKNEMLKNLKDIGNSFLGQFGLSTDDFKVDKDPVTGSYSLSMNKSNGS
jgi:valyl-tRNA synthetase